MGCQCANKEEETKNEILKKDKNLQNDQFLEDNNYDNKDRIFSLTSQNNENPSSQIHEDNENNINEQIGNNYNIDNEDEYNENRNEKKRDKYSDYPQRMLLLINKIRKDPVSYADVILESIQDIVEEQDKDDETKTRIIYKKKVKVALNRGEAAFSEAAEELRNMNSLPPLEFKNDICIPLPEEEDEIKDSSYLREQVKNMRENVNIDVFFKDLIKVPEVSALLMIVDDSGKNPGKKRQAVLNKDFKYIGISSKFIGKNFIAYFAFSK